METILLPAVAAAMVFIIFLLLMLQWTSSDQDRRKKTVLDKMSRDVVQYNVADVNLLKEKTLALSSSGISGLFAKIPGVQSTFALLLQSGLEKEATPFLLGVLVLFLVLTLILRKLVIGIVPVGLFVAIAITYFVPRRYLQYRIARRNSQFITLFPDAIDMIIRSIKSGHPLNIAMKLIADNMDDPVREEFRQVVDEVSYGRTLTEALGDMAKRIGEADLNFFVVVLSVQQETGGSLAEVLTNLSGVIRKRRQLHLKVRALTSEGRVSSYVLGALPVLIFCALYYLTPDYVDPLFHTFGGNVILATSCILVVGAIWIVRIMVDLKV